MMSLEAFELISSSGGDPTIIGRGDLFVSIDKFYTGNDLGD
jgi:hypothetical protein